MQSIENINIVNGTLDSSCVKTQHYSYFTILINSNLAEDLNCFYF